MLKLKCQHFKNRKDREKKDDSYEKKSVYFIFGYSYCSSLD